MVGRYPRQPTSTIQMNLPLQTLGHSVFFHVHTVPARELTANLQCGYFLHVVSIHSFVFLINLVIKLVGCLVTILFLYLPENGFFVNADTSFTKESHFDRSVLS